MSLNVELIRESFEVAKPLGEKIPAKFYEILFDDHPEAKGLFEGKNMVTQGKLLLNSLVFIVDKIDQEEDLLKFLNALGTRHGGYGSEPEHYDWVGAALLKTFAFFFEDNWTKELEEQWTIAYGVIATAMIAAQQATKSGSDDTSESAEQETAEEAPLEIEDITAKAKGLCRNLLKDVIAEEIDEEFEALARGKVRRLIMKILEEEYEEMVTKKAS